MVYKLGPNATNICWVIVLTSENSKFSCWNRPIWLRKIGQGHPSSNLTKTLMRFIHGISLGPMWLIFVVVLTTENCKFSCWNRPPWPQKIGQGHPSSNLTKTLRIHPWYKFGPNATNICWVIVLTSKMLMDRRTDGHANIIVWVGYTQPAKKCLVACDKQMYAYILYMFLCFMTPGTILKQKHSSPPPPPPPPPRDEPVTVVFNLWTTIYIFFNFGNLMKVLH